MAYSKSWNLADAFTISQASYLWHELDPPNGEVEEALRYGRPPDVAAVAQSLLAAVESGALIGKWHDPLAEHRRDTFKITIRREALVEFAKARKQFPAFLFDTVLTESNTLDSSTSTALTGNDIQSKNVGGRPRKYDWDGCYAQIVRIADEDALPGVQNELVRKLQEWFLSECGTEPADSEIKKKISTIYQRLRGAGWKPRDG
jgi:hypothetical protein